MKYTQVKLTRENTESICWVDADKVKLNRKVTLKGSDDWWTISEIFGTRDQAHFDIAHKTKFESIERT